MSEEPRKRPRKKGQARAKAVAKLLGSIGRWLMRLCGLGLLLILPMRASAQLVEGIDLRWVLGYLACVAIATAFTNWSDKKKAIANEWRTPESTLHFLELIGGWPASFLVQRIIRHKTSKGSYQSTFWLIVTLHQYLAIDYVQSWRWSIWLYENALILLHS